MRLSIDIDHKTHLDVLIRTPQIGIVVPDNPVVLRYDDSC